MSKWHNVGLFKDERSAKILVPRFFKDPGFEAHFSDACNFGYKDDERIMLRVRDNYWCINIGV